MWIRAQLINIRCLLIPLLNSDIRTTIVFALQCLAVPVILYVRTLLFDALVCSDCDLKDQQLQENKADIAQMKDMVRAMDCVN